MKLTKAAVAVLKSDKPDQVFWDDELPGFGVRIRGTTKRWYVRYRVGLQQHKNPSATSARSGSMTLVASPASASRRSNSVRTRPPSKPHPVRPRLRRR